jgi:hypothetical protein
VFVASGASHAAGAVPDPGVTAGTTKFLREDSTWSVPAGGGGGVITGGANFGTGTGQIYDATDTTATTIAFKTIKAGTNVTVTNNAQDVTISASGGGGGGVPIEKTANYTAVAGDVIAANTSGGSFTVTLPSAPSAGQSVQVMDELATWAINPLTINPNGSLIERISQNQTFRKSGGCLTFTYQNSTNGWLLNGDIPGTKWNEFDSTFDALRSLSDGRTIAVVTANASAHSIRADTVQSSGKYYFEFKLLRVEAGGAPLIGVGNSFASLTNYCGVDANGFGMYSNGQLFHFGGQTTYTSYAANDIVGVAVDLTPTTGSVTFYKNNVVNGTVTGQTLSPMYPMASGSGSNNYATGMGRLCTRAADCIYAPPAGFSYWDV